MADSTQLASGLRKIVREHVAKTLKNTLFNRAPLTYFLLNKDGDKSSFEGLGRPNTGVFMSGVDVARAKKETILSSRVYEPLIQTAKPDVNDGKTMGMYSSLPVRTSWTTTSPSTYLKRPRFKWHERADPYKIPNKEMRITKRTAPNEIKAWQGIESIAALEMKSVEAVHMDYWTNRLWGVTGGGAPTDEDLDVWDNIHSIAAALKDDNVYGGVDRSSSANTYWRGNYNANSTTAASKSFEDLINYCNYDLGFSDKGGKLDLILTDKTNYKRAKAEAKAKGGTVLLGGQGIPNFGQFGFKREIVEIDNTFVVYDPFCPTGHLAALNLDTWTLAIHPDANFAVSTPEDQQKVEGGDDAHTGHVRTEMMVVCEVPSQNAYWTS